MVLVHQELNHKFHDGTIIDFETIGTFDRRYRDHRTLFDIYPVTCGTLHDEGLVIYYIDQEEEIAELLRLIDAKLGQLPEPFWAFNKAFEQGIIFNHLKKHVKIWELNAWKYEKKEKAVRALGIPNFDDPFHGDGRKVVEAWPTRVADCVKHNRACLLKEKSLWKCRFEQSQFRILKV